MQKKILAWKFPLFKTFSAGLPQLCMMGIFCKANMACSKILCKCMVKWLFLSLHLELPYSLLILNLHLKGRVKSDVGTP